MQLKNKHILLFSKDMVQSEFFTIPTL